MTKNQEINVILIIVASSIWIHSDIEFTELSNWIVTLHRCLYVIYGIIWGTILLKIIEKYNIGHYIYSFYITIFIIWQFADFIDSYIGITYLSGIDSVQIFFYKLMMLGSGFCISIYIYDWINNHIKNI